MAATRKPLPYIAFDDLESGFEYRVKRIGMSHVTGVFDGWHLDGDGSLWLRVALPKTLLWIGAKEVQWADGYPMIQRVCR
jgi:hypothetical protein